MTGVQTCALPISGAGGVAAEASARKEAAGVPDAVVSDTGFAGAERLLLHSVFATELFEGDEDGRSDPSGWRAGVFYAVRSSEELELSCKCNQCKGPSAILCVGNNIFLL